MYIYKWHVTGDTWQMTRENDTSQDMNIVSTFQVPSSNGLVFMVYWRFGGKGWLTRLIKYKGVCRTDPATPGLLIIPTGGPLGNQTVLLGCAPQDSLITLGPSLGKFFQTTMQLFHCLSQRARHFNFYCFYHFYLFSCPSSLLKCSGTCYLVQEFKASIKGQCSAVRAAK